MHVYHPSNDDATVASSESEEGTSTQTAPMVRSSSIKENDPLVGVPDNVKEIISVSQAITGATPPLPASYTEHAGSVQLLSSHLEGHVRAS